VNWLKKLTLTYRQSKIATRGALSEQIKKNNLHEITQIVVIDSVDRISHFQFVIGERSFKWSLCNWAWVMGIMVGPIKRKLIHCRKICRNQRIKIRLGCVSSSRCFQRQKNL